MTPDSDSTLVEKLDEILGAKHSVFFVQIGSNDGLQGDPLRPLVVAHPTWSGLLVEPVPFVFERLRMNYHYDKRLIFEKVAVGTVHERRDFFYLSEAALTHYGGNLPFQYDQLGSFSRDHIIKHLDGKMLYPDLAQFIVKEQVECIPLQALLDRHNVNVVDLLHVDAEGYDFTVLSQLNFNRYRPRAVLYEHLHLNETDRADARDLLTSNGYELMECGADTLAIRT